MSAFLVFVFRASKGLTLNKFYQLSLRFTLSGAISGLEQARRPSP
jgi:hypothetical protein